MHHGDELLVMANPTNIGTAMILEQIGFRALGTSSAALARSLGRSDGLNQLSRSESIEHAAGIAAHTSVPVSGDFENGYGDDPVDVATTVSAAIDAGLAGCCIEDTVGTPDGQVHDRGLAIERVAAAAAAVGDEPFVFVARSELMLFDRANLAEVISRLASFETAGATAVYAPGLIDLDEVRAVVESVQCPVNVLVGLDGQQFCLDDLREVGVSRVSVGSGFDRAATDGLRARATALLDAAAPMSAIFG